MQQQCSPFYNEQSRDKTTLCMLLVARSDTLNHQVLLLTLINMY
jgi:hypothetical protein